jgi:hypothetical protein
VLPVWKWEVFKGGGAVNGQKRKKKVATEEVEIVHVDISSSPLQSCIAQFYGYTFLHLLNKFEAGQYLQIVSSFIF